MPLLIRDYSATEDIFTRALPFLTVVALFEIAGAIDLDWSLGANLAAFVGGAVLLMVSYGVFNRIMGRPFAALPRSVGVPELTAFVLLPALLPAIFGGQLGSAALTALFNLVVVGLAWLIIGFGVFSIIRWTGARLFQQIAASLTVMVRALPLILFFGLLSFFTAEIWQLFATVPTGRYVTAAVLFLVIGVVFLTVQLPHSVDEVQAAVDLAGVPLRGPERFNLALLIMVSKALQILLVTALVWLFFGTFGALLVDMDVVAVWTGTPPDPLFDIDLFGEEVTVTRQLVRATFGIAAFSGLYYTVAMSVDTTYGGEFVAELTEQMRSTFAIRADYLAALAAASPDSDTDSGSDELAPRPAATDPVTH